MALATAWTEHEIVWLFVLAGVLTAAIAGWRDRGSSNPISGSSV